MASTRNKNTHGDYSLEQQRYKAHEYYMTHPNSVGTVYYPGNGLLGQSCPSTCLTFNAIHIESYLRGIGTTNLVQQKTIPKPEFYHLPSLDICERIPMIIPEPLQILSHQRPFPT
jgi:hypothetical protein